MIKFINDKNNANDILQITIILLNEINYGSFKFFIDNFVSNNRIERWQILAKGKWQKCANEIKHLDKH